MDLQSTETLDTSEYGDAEETLDVMVRVEALLQALLDRKQPRFLEHELRRTLAAVSHQLGFEEEWIH
jgi:hypothetical protein